MRLDYRNAGNPPVLQHRDGTQIVAAVTEFSNGLFHDDATVLVMTLNGDGSGSATPLRLG
jgi:hypothetical protein